MDCIEKSSTKNRWERAQELIKQNTSNAIRLFTNYKYIVINYYHSNEFSLINIYKKLRQSSFRYIIAAVLLVYVILYFNSPSTTLQSVSINTKQLFNINSSQSQSRQRRGPPYLTYIISVSTQRFNRTKNNLESRLPNFFNTKKKQPVSRNDSRMYRNGADENAASLMLTFIDLWDEIGALPNTEYSDNDWVFIFEDDVNVVPNSIIQGFYPKIFAQWNYSNPNTSIAGIVEQALEMGKDDGIIYLGTCGPEYENNSKIYYSYDGLFELRRGVYFCTHAMAFTKWRARRIWGDFAVYKLSHGESGSDTIARQWMIRSRNFPISVAANIHWPPTTGHYGFFYQDRGAVPSTRG